MFEYLFILFNATQGIFLMFAFVCNRRVYNMYKQLFVGKEKTRVLSVSNVKTSETSTSF